MQGMACQIQDIAVEIVLYSLKVSRTNVPEAMSWPAAEGSISVLLAGGGALKHNQIEHRIMETGSIMRIPIIMQQEPISTIEVTKQIA